MNKQVIIHKCDWCWKKRQSVEVDYKDGFHRYLCWECRRKTQIKDGITYLKTELITND